MFLGLGQCRLILLHLIPLAGQLLHLVDALPFGLQKIHLGDGVMFEQLLVGLSAFRLHGDGRFETDNILAGLLQGRPALVNEVLSRRHFRLIFSQLIDKQLLLQRDILRIGIGRQLKGRLSCDQCAQSRSLNPGCTIFVGRPIMVRTILRGIQLNQHLAFLHHLPVRHINRRDHAGLIGLNHFGIAAGNNFPLRRRHDIDPAEGRPQHREREDRHNGPENRPADRRRRRLLNLKHGGEKLRGPRRGGQEPFARSARRVVPTNGS